MVNVPETYYGEPVEPISGLFDCDTPKKLYRYIDHADGTWYYGHDERAGTIIPWMRLREDVDRTSNDLHLLHIVDGIWCFKPTDEE